MLSRLLKPVDRIIDGITMYRLLLYYLIGLILVAMAFSALGVMHYSALTIGVEALTTVVACWLINKMFAYMFDAPVNPESSILTGLILTLIIPASLANLNFLFFLAAAGLAMASKYVLAIRAKHIFNPAAIAVVLTAIGPHQDASWWVGTASMLPFVVVGGLLVARKTQREPMVFTFLVATTIATALFSITGKSNVGLNLVNMVLTSGTFFLGFVMLTEPYSSPTTRNKQLWYAALVGVLIAPQVHVGHFYTTPEIALIIGNIFAFIVSPKIKLFPYLTEKVKVAADTVQFAFMPERKIAYQPGQYMEWTLPHTNMDERGARRYFTLASSPTEDELLLGVKFYDNSSSYKSAMLDMDRNSAIVAGQLAGDFVMPKDKNEKLVFIAGGIGITPFRSMVKYLLDTNQRRNVIMLYSVRTEADIAYRDVFEEARQRLGMQTHYILTGSRANITKAHTHRGKITASIIRQAVPDLEERTFYISGTHFMVEDIQAQLHHLGVHHRNIKIDFFPGY